MTIIWKSMKGFMLLLSMTLLLAGGVATSNTTSEKAAFNLIIQNADNGTLIKQADGTYILTLRGVAPEAIQIVTDPYPASRRIEVDSSVLKSAFNNSTMKAALVLHTSNNSSQDTRFLVLSNPKYDAKMNVLAFSATPLNGDNGTNLKPFDERADKSTPELFGMASIYYDPNSSKYQTCNEVDEQDASQEGCDNQWSGPCYDMCIQGKLHK